jgi:hypothetical protein
VRLDLRAKTHDQAEEPGTDDDDDDSKHARRHGDTPMQMGKEY